MPVPRKFAIGQRIWKFDPNHRIYARDAEGHATGGPIYCEYFRAFMVNGIVGRSYLIGLDTDRSPEFSVSVSFIKAEKEYHTDAERDQMIWVNVHRHRMVELIRDITDTATLREIAALIGYDDSKES